MFFWSLAVVYQSLTVVLFTFRIWCQLLSGHIWIVNGGKNSLNGQAGACLHNISIRFPCQKTRNFLNNKKMQGQLSLQQQTYIRNFEGLIFFSGVLRSNFLHCARVGQGSYVTNSTAFGNVSQETAHDLT